MCSGIRSITSIQLQSSDVELPVVFFTRVLLSFLHTMPDIGERCKPYFDLLHRILKQATESNDTKKRNLHISR